MSNQELNEKLIKFAGLQLVKIHEGDDEASNFFTAIDTEGCLIVSSLFITSLDACLKWLVPKLTWVSIDGGEVDFEGQAAISGVGWEMARAETPALALCLAIEKLIDQSC